MGNSVVHGAGRRDVDARRRFPPIGVTTAPIEPRRARRPRAGGASGRPASAPGDVHLDLAVLGRVGREGADRVAALLVGSPREVLARIVPGDALGVRAVAAQRLRARALLLDGDRLHLCAMARCAREAPTRRGALGAWLGRCVDSAIDALLAEETSSDPPGPGDAHPSRGTPSSTERAASAPPGALAQFAEHLGLDVEAAQRGRRAFHRLPLEDRAAFFALVIEGLPLERVVATTAERVGRPASATEVARRARRGLLAWLTPGERR